MGVRLHRRIERMSALSGVSHVPIHAPGATTGSTEPEYRSERCLQLAVCQCADGQPKLGGVAAPDRPIRSRCHSDRRVRLVVGAAAGWYRPFASIHRAAAAGQHLWHVAVLASGSSECEGPVPGAERRSLDTCKYAAALWRGGGAALPAPTPACAERKPALDGARRRAAHHRQGDETEASTGSRAWRPQRRGLVANK